MTIAKLLMGASSLCMALGAFSLAVAGETGSAVFLGVLALCQALVGFVVLRAVEQS